MQDSFEADGDGWAMEIVVAAVEIVVHGPCNPKDLFEWFFQLGRTFFAKLKALYFCSTYIYIII